MKLTNKQTQVLYKLVTDLKNGAGETTLGGYAGTGKTSLIKYLTGFFPNFGVCAYTGKASNVLQKKGIPATTIHSRIYKPYFDHGSVFFDLTDDPGCQGFFVDESSMVSEEIYGDLKYFNLPIVFVGDHGQLEPVNSDFNLMANPDYKLEEIHRNAGDIAYFADHLRKGLASRGFRGQDGTTHLLSKYSVDTDLMTEVDQVICAYNKTRVQINDQVRKAKKYSGHLHIGERIMCLRNNKTQGLFNGMQGTILNLYTKKKRKYMDFMFGDTVFEGIWYDDSQFGQEKYKFRYGQNTPNPFDFAYGITCHKSQGDEFPKVLVIEQKCNKWDHRRWSYTAASRAKNELYWGLAT